MMAITEPTPYPYDAEAISEDMRLFMNPVTVMKATIIPAIMNKTPIRTVRNPLPFLSNSTPTVISVSVQL
jgi:hypothetical protein